MLRIASRASVRWLVAASSVLALAAGAASLGTQRPKVAVSPVPESTATSPAGWCTPVDEQARATAVIHFFDEEIRYATAADPVNEKAAALMALPMPCTRSEHAYPALAKHIDSTVHALLARDHTQAAARIVAIADAYNVGDRLVASLTTAVDAAAQRFPPCR